MFTNPNYTTIDLSFLENHGKESYDVIRDVRQRMAENEGRVRTWNIERASLTPRRMYWTARDNRNGQTLIFHAPGFSIKVKGATFQGGLMIIRDKTGDYHFFLFDLVRHTVMPYSFVKEDQLITTLDRLINGFPMYIQQSKFNS
jgi:hypothetical protein